jgi:outer membrane protein assembly factor BamB
MPAARAIAFAAFAGACGLLGATASAQPVPTTTWPQYQYGSDHNAVFDTPHWSVSWRSAPAGDMIHGGLSIVGATLYFESFDHNVYALDALTGKELWRRPLRYIAMNTPVVGDGLVFAGTGMAVGEPPGGLAAPLSGMAEGDSVYALDAKSGESVWKFDTKGHNMPTGALLSNGRRSQFIFSGGHERIFSLDAHSGELLWQRSALGIDKMASLALYHEQIYGSSGQKTLDQATYFQSGATIYYEFFGRTWTVDGTGKLAWSAPYGEPGSSPTVADERVFVESWQF